MQPDVINLWYFKLWILLDIIVWVWQIRSIYTILGFKYKRISNDLCNPFIFETWYSVYTSYLSNSVPKLVLLSYKESLWIDEVVVKINRNWKTTIQFDFLLMSKRLSNPEEGKKIKRELINVALFLSFCLNKYSCIPLYGCSQVGSEHMS